MNYIFWVIGIILSILGSWYVWAKYDVVKWNQFKDNKKKLAFVIITTIITLVLFILGMTREYEYADIIKIIITYILLLSVSAVDYKYHIIPNRIIGMAVLCRLIVFAMEYCLLPEQFLTILIDSIIGAILGFGILFIVYIICKQGIGFGDVKLIGTIGFIFGILIAYNILFYTMFILAIYIIIMWMCKKINKKSQIPFAPFVYCGFVLCIVFNLI